MKYTERQVNVPLCAVTTASGLANKTGSWKFARPVFIDRTSPCTEQCPAGEDIAGYMYLAGQGRFEEAFRLITEENPFPAIMGRICFHPCEGKCNRAEHDEAVSIHTVERFIGDYGLSHNLMIPVTEPEKDKKIAIVGSGPAGLSAAYHLRKRGYPVTVFESAHELGGLMRFGIPPSRLPKDILDGEINRLTQMGIVFKLGANVGEELPWETLRAEFDALFVALGAYEEQPLEIEGVDKGGIFHALAFLKEINTGMRPSVGTHAAIIGGGNSAIDCARSSRRLGAEVTVVYRRSEAEMPAHPEEIEMAKEEGVEFLFLAAPHEVYGKEAVSGLKLEKMALGEVDASGRRRPVGTGGYFDIACDSVIIAIGESAKTEALPPFITHTKGVVTTDSMGQTPAPAVFAGGDIINIPHTVTHAIGSGKRAAVAIERLLEVSKVDQRELDQFRWGESGTISIGRMRGANLFTRRHPSRELTTFASLNPFYFDHRPRIKGKRLPLDKRLASFAEVVPSPTEEEAIGEARRCFTCGSCTECGNCYIFCPDSAIKKDLTGYGYVADMDYCKGCGICVNECPRGAMNLELME